MNSPNTMKCQGCGNDYEGKGKERLPAILFHDVFYCPDCALSSLPILNEVLGLLSWVEKNDQYGNPPWPGVLDAHLPVVCQEHRVWKINSTCAPNILFFVDGLQDCVMCLKRNHPAAFDNLKAAMLKAQPSLVEKVIAEQKGKPETLQERLRMNPLAAHARSSLR